MQRYGRRVTINSVEEGKCCKDANHSTKHEVASSVDRHWPEQSLDHTRKECRSIYSHVSFFDRSISNVAMCVRSDRDRMEMDG